MVNTILSLKNLSEPSRNSTFVANLTESCRKIGDGYVSVGNFVSVAPFSSSGGYSMLKIPYKCKGKSNEFSRYIFLPDRKDGLQDLLQMFHSDNSLFYRDFNLEKRKLDEIWIPKFKITCKFEAHDVMEEMGLTLPFDPKNMDITEIVSNKWINVSKVFQKSFIKVDEEGTEAAAVIYMSMRIGCSVSRPHLEPTSFVADHPFMFMIREDTSRAVFFIGVVLNPVENSLA